MSDTRQEKCEQAVAKKHSGYNCAQAVACTFCEEAGLDDETMRNLMQGFGAGLATMEGNCGAIAGAVAAAGMINKDQMNTFQDARLIMQQFMEQNAGCAFDHAAVYGAEWNGYLQRTERNRNRTCGPRL